MKLISLTCNECGAPLEVPENARFATCNYCSARLAVHTGGSAAYTEVLEKLDQQTEQIADDLETIKLQNELEALDREWENEKERYLVHTQHGGRRVPSAAGSVFGGIVAAVFGLFWTGFAASMGGPSFFPLFGLLFVGVGIVVAVNGVSKAGRYQQAETRHRERRQEILDKLRGR